MSCSTIRIIGNFTSFNPISCLTVNLIPQFYFDAAKFAMGKHKNSTQNCTMLQFMEKHADIARGHTKGDRVQIEAYWQELTETLNSQGPPIKDANGWKKAWTDWKCEVRKKLAHNRKESKATGGGLCTKYTLSDAEESLAVVSGLYASVDSILHATSVGLSDVYEEETIYINDKNIDDIPTTSQNCMLRRDTLPSTPKKRKVDPSMQGSVKDFISAESIFHTKLEEKLSGLLEVNKENRVNMKRMCRSIEKISDSLAGIRKDLKAHNLETLKVASDKNELKRRQIEIEEIKLQHKIKLSHSAQS